MPLKSAHSDEFELSCLLVHIDIRSAMVSPVNSSTTLAFLNDLCFALPGQVIQTLLENFVLFSFSVLVPIKKKKTVVLKLLLWVLKTTLTIVIINTLTTWNYIVKLNRNSQRVGGSVGNAGKEFQKHMSEK